MDALMRGADALVHPSLYEGFGLVLVEAMARGVPVLAARATALPETGGDACDYFDPLDVGDMAAAIRRVVDDRAHHAELAARGLRAPARCRGPQRRADGGGLRRDAVSQRTTVLVLSRRRGAAARALACPRRSRRRAPTSSSSTTPARTRRARSPSGTARGCSALRERVSYAAAINAGIVASEGDAVLLLNADCVLPTASSRPRARPPGERGVGSVAPRLIRATGMKPDERLDVLDAAGMVVDRRRKNTLVGHNEPATAYARAAEVFGGDGACVLYRREVLEACAIGGEVLDEQLELWASDVDLAWRARLLGWRCMYEPRAIAWHMRFYSPTTRSGLPEAHRRLQFRNRLLMMVKNDSWRDVRGDLHRIAFYELLAIGHIAPARAPPPARLRATPRGRCRARAAAGASCKPSAPPACARRSACARRAERLGAEAVEPLSRGAPGARARRHAATPARCEPRSLRPRRRGPGRGAGGGCRRACRSRRRRAATRSRVARAAPAGRAVRARTCRRRRRSPRARCRGSAAR